MYWSVNTFISKSIKSICFSLMRCNIRSRGPSNFSIVTLNSSIVFTFCIISNNPPSNHINLMIAMMVNKKLPEGSFYPTTIFTIRFGTTMSLRTVFPSICACTDGKASAISSTIFLSSSIFVMNLPRTLPLTCTTIST